MSFITNALGLTEGRGEKEAERASAIFDDLQAPEQSNVDFRDFISRQGDTELAGVQVDPRLQDAQFGALGQLRDVANQGGLTTADQARLDAIGQSEAIREQGQREAILADAQSRGVGGSGLELASLLGAQQGGADRAANTGRDVAVNAENRALQAVRDSANLAGGIRTQAVGEQQKAATAQDLINQFNANAGNQAGFATANERVAAPARRFEQDLARRQAQADALNQIGAQGAAREGRLTSTIGAALGATGAALGGKN